jgi:chromosome segregation ATPase
MASFVPGTMTTGQSITSDKAKATQLNKEIKELEMKISATQQRIAQISKQTKNSERDQRRLDRGSVKRGAEEGMDVDRVDDGTDDLMINLKKLDKELEEKKRNKKAMIARANKKKRQAKDDAAAARKLLTTTQAKATATAKAAAEESADDDLASLMGTLTISQKTKKAQSAAVDVAAANKKLKKAEIDIFNMNSLLASLEEGGAVKRRSTTKRHVKRNHKTTGKKKAGYGRKNHTAKKSSKTRKYW